MSKALRHIARRVIFVDIVVIAVHVNNVNIYILQFFPVARKFFSSGFYICFAFAQECTFLLYVFQQLWVLYGLKYIFGLRFFFLKFSFGPLSLTSAFRRLLFVAMHTSDLASWLSDLWVSCLTGGYLQFQQRRDSAATNIQFVVIVDARMLAAPGPTLEA